MALWQVFQRRTSVYPAYSDHSDIAEEGDLRLVDEVAVSNWQLGRLEVFFEGSWSQVCAREFDGADADVACRQLGFGAGSVGPNRVNGAPALEDRLVFPVVALTTPGCNGTEDSLLDCGPFTGRIVRTTDRDCFGVNNPGLTLACVATPEEGAHFQCIILLPLSRF